MNDAAQDVLLWGARGTGKSALVASAVAHVQAAGGAVGLIEVASDRLNSLPRLFDIIAATERPFAIFIDDLPPNVAGAEACGWHAIHHRSPERTVEQLRALGVRLPEPFGQD